MWDKECTTKSDKARGTTRVLLSNGENKSLALTMGTINTPITKSPRWGLFTVLSAQCV